MHASKINSIRRQRRDIVHVAPCEQSFLKKFFRTDEQSVPGKRGIAGVRRITIAGRSERQHLPQTLTAGDQKIGKDVRFIAQIADAKASRKRSWMKQNA